MHSFKHLQLQTLDQHLAKIHVPDVPSGGWIKAIRSCLGMSMQQLAGRLRIAKQSVARLERHEVTHAITLKSLHRVAESLGCRFVYAFIPHEGDLQTMLHKQVLSKAREMMAAVDHTMQLEAQGVGNLQAKIEAIANELAQHPNPALWE